MRYIVWRTPYKSYNRQQGDGYFVKWKSKTEDEFSVNWFDANKYKTIGPAMSRLNLQLTQNIKSIDDFFKLNNLTKSLNREKSISEILDEKSDTILSFEVGHIDKIDDEGNFCGNAGQEVMEYIEEFIRKNINKENSIQKKFESLGVENYIDKSVSDEDFWNEVLKK